MDILTEAVISPFQYEFMMRALAVSLLVGIVCPVLGAYVVTRGLGFMGDAMAHSILPGVIGAFMLGVSPFFGAIPMAIAVALTIGYLVRRVGISEDTSIGILFAGLFALGLAMLTASRGLPVNLEDLLLGQALGASMSDVLITLALTIGVLAVMAAVHKEMVFASFDPSGASVLGLPTQRLDYLLLILLAVVTVIALYAVGVVLVISMLITPAATAQMLARNFTKVMFVGVVFGVASAVIGLYVSYHYNLPPGPSMALTATSFFILGGIYRGGMEGVLRRAAA